MLDRPTQHGIVARTTVALRSFCAATVARATGPLRALHKLGVSYPAPALIAPAPSRRILAKGGSHGA